MAQPFLRNMILATALTALGGAASLAQTAPQSQTPAAEPSTDAGVHDGTSESDQPVTDTWITTKVKAELALIDGVKSTDISVKTVDGVVTLTGVLDSDTAVKKAEAGAQSVKGVKEVDSSGLKSKS